MIYSLIRIFSALSFPPGKCLIRKRDRETEMFDKSKLENYQLYIEEELAEMDQVLTKYRNKQITLKELLEYFQVEWFCNYAYVKGQMNL